MKLSEFAHRSVKIIAKGVCVCVCVCVCERERERERAGLSLYIKSLYGYIVNQIHFCDKGGRIHFRVLY